jgi:hypothetical protein
MALLTWTLSDERFQDSTTAYTAWAVATLPTSHHFFRALALTPACGALWLLYLPTLFMGMFGALCLFGTLALSNMMWRSDAALMLRLLGERR